MSFGWLTDSTAVVAALGGQAGRCVDRQFDHRPNSTSANRVSERWMVSPAIATAGSFWTTGTIEIATLDNYVAEIDADSEINARVIGSASIGRDELFLQFYSAIHGVHCAGKRHRRP